ncbi:hypothetical protein VTO42DRAFT_6652 [Malbranchea cinnamomea]
MADILTQLQTCLDQLATQFYATLCYLTTYHDHSPAIPPPNVPTATPQLKKIPKNAPTKQAAPSGNVSAPAGGDDKSGAAQAQASAEQRQQQQQPEANPPGPPRPDSPNTFRSRQRELARDLIIKEQQIEYLISVLPGIGSSEKEQEGKIRQLAAELRVAEEERRAKRREMRKLGERVDELLEAVSRGIGV